MKEVRLDVSLLLLSRNRAPGPRRLVGAGAVATAAAVGAAGREERPGCLAQPPGSWKGHSLSRESGSPFQEPSL